MAKIIFTINTRQVSVEADPEQPLLWVVRDMLHLKGTKYGCGIGQCGACTVLVDGKATRSCLQKIADLQQKSVTTIEGLGNERLHPVQQAWIDEQVPQCGYCQSGQIMSAVALLDGSPGASEEELIKGMTGNLCRCGTYDRIKKALRKIATNYNTEGTYE